MKKGRPRDRPSVPARLLSAGTKRGRKKAPAETGAKVCAKIGRTRKQPRGQSGSQEPKRSPRKRPMVLPTAAISPAGARGRDGAEKRAAGAAPRSAERAALVVRPRGAGAALSRPLAHSRRGRSVAGERPRAPLSIPGQQPESEPNREDQCIGAEHQQRIEAQSGKARHGAASRVKGAALVFF